MIELSGDDSFVIYQEPQKKTSNFIKGEWEKFEKNEILEKDTFVVNQFNSSSYKLVGEISELESSVKIDSPKEIKINSTNKKSYIDSVDKTISKCQKKEISKCIISRIITEKININDFFSLYQNLTNQYQHGLKYILNHPEHGMWIGISPETLIKGNKKQGFYSHALAGSKGLNSTKDWTNKEITEHQFVVDYIKEKIKRYGQIINTSKTYEKVAGNIVHLNQDFYFKIKTDLFHFINQLHPTPAIAGIPLEKSLDFISKTESHPRSFYSGFIGTMKKDTCNLYVNLRCGRITQNEIQLFVGGGITKNSIPNEEYLETEIKSQTLLSVIKKI
jgi:isochorismate synthase